MRYDFFSEIISQSSIEPFLFCCNLKLHFHVAELLKGIFGVFSLPTDIKMFGIKGNIDDIFDYCSVCFQKYQFCLLLRIPL